MYKKCIFHFQSAMNFYSQGDNFMRTSSMAKGVLPVGFNKIPANDILYL